MTGNGTGYTYASLGGNAGKLNITATGASADVIDNSTGASIAKEAVSDIASAYVLGKAADAIGNLITEGADVLKDGNSTDQAIKASDNAAKVTTETFTPPIVE